MNRRMYRISVILLVLLGLALACAPVPAQAASGVNMYRLYNPNSGEHFYTASLDEAVSVCEAGWRWEGIGWVAPESSSTPVYRLYNPNVSPTTGSGEHHYTMSMAECNSLVEEGWNYEGIGWYSDDAKSVPLYRQYNPNEWNNNHNYTASTEERDNLVSLGWDDEGIAWYGSSAPAQTIEGRWITTAAWGSSALYWLAPDGTIAKDRFIAASEGTGFVAYAAEDGAILCGKLQTAQGVLVADEDGRLIENSSGEGWVVTGEYDGGGKQRYYLVSSGGHLYAKTGFFNATIDGEESQFYGLQNEGYVARGFSKDSMLIVGTNGYSANNEGRIELVATNIVRTRDTYLATVTWRGDMDYIDALAAKAKDIGSSTDYFIAVDDTLCRVVVFRRSGSFWKAIQMWNCNGGRAHYTGTFSIRHKRICNWADSYFGMGYNDWSSDYIEGWTETNQNGHSRYVEGKGYECCAAFHSTGHSTTGWDNSGCTGLLYDNAKWIYDTIPLGTTVYIF